MFEAEPYNEMGPSKFVDGEKKVKCKEKRIYFEVVPWP